MNTSCKCRSKAADNTAATNNAAKKYPGVAIDQADNNRVSKNRVDNETCLLNNNPATTQMNEVDASTRKNR